MIMVVRESSGDCLTTLAVDRSVGGSETEPVAGPVAEGLGVYDPEL